MKRTVALWAAVLFSLHAWSADAVAQADPAPADADTVQAGTPASPPGVTAPAPAADAADTLTAAARIRRAQSSRMTYAISVGLGTAFGLSEQGSSSLRAVFTDEYDPSFGFHFGVGVRRWDLELSLTFDYNFFFTTRPRPDDLSILNTFLNLKYLPLKTTARPYVLACGGYWRSWIVDPLNPNDPPLTFAREVEGGDNVYDENVLGYGGGLGVEVEIDKTRRIFFEGRYVQGRTRQTVERSNLEIVPLIVGLTWEF